MIGLEAERFMEVDDRLVAVLLTARATGAESGASVKAWTIHELEFRDGLVVRLKVHPDRDAALRSLGLAE